MPPPILAVLGSALAVSTAYALGAVALRNRPAPLEITLAIGAVLESLFVFLVLLTNVAHAGLFIPLAIIMAAITWKFGRRVRHKPFPIPTTVLPIIAVYGAWYLVNALAPEVMPDGIVYHLGLPREYARLGGFPGRAAFYELVPQGMEMLYTVAYTVGRHGAAKLVEFTFFVATLPLIFRIGGRLGLSEAASAVPAVLFFSAPIIGLTGASSYTDAAGIFFLLAALYLLLDGRVFPAGLCAGFCYAIKMPGLMVAICAVGWMLWRGRPRAAAIVALGAAVSIAPWMMRSIVLTGNPIAPLGNGFFSNPYFHAATEKELVSGLHSLGGVTPLQLPWELAFGDALGGTYGPLLLALPLGLLALRYREGRLLLLGAALLALPWLANTGARFLMPSIVLAGFALAMVLPRPAAWAAVALQAILCWPPVLDRIEPPSSFRLHHFPLAAALGLESEEAYCRRTIPDYDAAQMIQRTAPENSRTLALAGVAQAYLDRNVAVWWQSAETDTLLDTLRLAALYAQYPVFEWKASWRAEDVRALRLRSASKDDGEWDISEVHFFSDDAPVYNSPQWTFASKPNPWEAPLAFDGNLATRWRTWEPVRRDMYLEVDFGHLHRLTSVMLVTHTLLFHVPLEVWGRDRNGAWKMLARDAQAVARAPQDLRLDASRALRRAGFRYLLVPTGSGGNAPIGNPIVDHQADWGVESVGQAGRHFLLRIR